MAKMKSFAVAVTSERVVLVEGLSEDVKSQFDGEEKCLSVKLTVCLVEAECEEDAIEEAKRSIQGVIKQSCAIEIKDEKTND